MFAVMTGWWEADIDHWPFFWEITHMVPLGMEVSESEDKQFVFFTTKESVKGLQGDELLSKQLC